MRIAEAMGPLADPVRLGAIAAGVFGSMPFSVEMDGRHGRW